MMSTQILGVVILVVNILTVMDILKSRMDREKKILWIIVAGAFPVIGCICYFVFSRKR